MVRADARDHGLGSPVTRDAPSRFAILRRWIGTDDTPLADADLALEAQRSRRDRRVGASTLAAIGGRGVGLLASFIAIPLSIGYLGVDRYGIFVALSSLTAMFVFADLGLGNGLLNVVSEANGRNDRAAASRAVSSAFFMLLGIAAVLAIVLLIAYPVIDWSGLFHVSNPTIADEVAPTAAVLLGLFAVALPLGVVERIRMGYQEGFINSVASMAGALLALAALAIAVWARASLPVLVLAVSAPPVVALGINGYRLWRKDRPWLRPRLGLADRTAAFRLARIGLLFLVLQLAVAVAYQSDVVVAGMILGPEAAATYAVTLKFFMLAPAIVGLYLVTLWPAYTEALARNDRTWVNRTLRRSVAIAAIASGVSSLALAVAGSWLIQGWTGGAINPPIELLIGAALWAVLSATFNAVAILLNAASVVLFQVILAITMAAASITFSVLFANWFGLAGIVWGTLLAYLLFSAIPVAIYLPRIINSIGRNATSDIHA